MGRKATSIPFAKERFKSILRSKGITQKQLAEDIGYNYGSISNAIHRGEAAERTVTDIAKYIGVDPNYLTGRNADDISVKRVLDILTSYIENDYAASGNLDYVRTALEAAGCSEKEASEIGLGWVFET